MTTIMKHYEYPNKSQQPLEIFIDKKIGTKKIIPLVSSKYDIKIDNGISVIKIENTYKNKENYNIEAIFTFPVPFQSIVTNLEANIDDRKLTAKAQQKIEARETYETAISDGKNAILHEEILQGLHMISVGNIMPKQEINITTTFILLLNYVNNKWTLRIPTTISDVYGTLDINKTDIPEEYGEVLNAEIIIDSKSKIIEKNFEKIHPLNKPIEIIVENTETKYISKNIDGKNISLTIEPDNNIKTDSIEADFVLDTSGSMKLKTDYCEDNIYKTKWNLVEDGIKNLYKNKTLTTKDTINLWSFSDNCSYIGTCTGENLENLFDKIYFENKGTRIYESLLMVSQQKNEKNILIVTDGKSWTNSNFEQIIHTGARVTVVLIGIDAIEIEMGRLAQITGGNLFIANNDNIKETIDAAISSMRKVSSPIIPIKDIPKKLTRIINGAKIKIEWSKNSIKEETKTGFEEYLLAISTNYAIAGLPQEKATKYAEKANIISKYTSLILVDEKIINEDKTIPNVVKIALPSSPNTLQNLGQPQFFAASFSDTSFTASAFQTKPNIMRGLIPRTHNINQIQHEKITTNNNFYSFKNIINWNDDAEKIKNGIIDNINKIYKDFIIVYSKHEKIIKEARKINIDSILFVLGLIAFLDKDNNRNADRVYKIIFKNIEKNYDFDKLIKSL